HERPGLRDAGRIARIDPRLGSQPQRADSGAGLLPDDRRAWSAFRHANAIAGIVVRARARDLCPLRGSPDQPALASQPRAGSRPAFLLTLQSRSPHPSFRLLASSEGFLFPTYSLNPAPRIPHLQT